MKSKNASAPEVDLKTDIKVEVSQNQEHNVEVSVENDKYPAPSTPQLKHGIRLVDNGDCQDHDHDQVQTNLSTEKECVDHDDPSKFVETICKDLVVYTTVITETTSSKSLEEGILKPSTSECSPDPKDDGKKPNEASENPSSRATKSSRRKIKVR